jgi:SAM-dependent methyltransferase
MNEYNFFSEGSPYLQHPLLTPERAVREVDFLLQQMRLAPAARILDVGCGFGRHTIELAKRGFRMTALDPSPAMISAARERAAAASVTPDFHQVRAEDFRTSLSFDAAICLFTTLGQVTAEGQGGLDLLTGVHEALAMGAPFAVEVPQREPTLNRLKTTDKFGNGQSYTKVSRHFNPQDKLLDERFEVISPQKSKIYHLHYRLFSHGELKAMLRAAGFAVRASFGNYSGKPLRQDDATMLVIAKAL